MLFNLLGNTKKYILEFIIILLLQGAPYVFERFSEAVLRSLVDVEIKYYHIFLTKVYTFQIP